MAGLMLVLLLVLLPYLSMCKQNDGKTALIIIDVQNCFLSGGTLAVNDADDVIPIINALRTKVESRFDVVILSQDWHCSDHVSFASQHPGYNPLETISLHYDVSGQLCKSENVTSRYAINCTSDVSIAPSVLRQTLWPDHCVINTTDAELDEDLIQRESDIIIYKGHTCDLDSYSVFYDNGRFGETRLQQVLVSRGIETVYLTGLATDYCVYWSAKDAKQLGYKTYVVVDATRGVAPGTTEAALRDMENLGITLVNSSRLLDENQSLPTGGATTLVYSVFCLFVAASSFLLVHEIGFTKLEFKH